MTLNRNLLSLAVASVAIAALSSCGGTTKECDTSKPCPGTQMCVSDKCVAGTGGSGGSTGGSGGATGGAGGGATGGAGGATGGSGGGATGGSGGGATGGSGGATGGSGGGATGGSGGGATGGSGGATGGSGGTGGVGGGSMVIVTGNPCMNAVTVTPGMAVTSSTADAGNNFVFTDGRGCVGSASVSSATAGDRVYVVSVPANQRLTAKLVGLDGGETSFDSTINVVAGLNNCGENKPNTTISCTASADDPQPQTVSYDNMTASAQSVYLIVDGFGSGSGPFTLNTSLGSVPAFLAGGETCATAAALPAMGTTIRSSSDGGVSDYSISGASSCRTTANAPDKTYSLTVPASKRATITVAPQGGFDPVVNVFASAAACGTVAMDGGTTGATCVAGSDASGTETVVVNNVTSAAVTYIVMIDGFSGEVGDYEISSVLSDLPALVAGGETCAAPVALTAGTAVTGTTAGKMNDYAFSTGGMCSETGSGPDVVYSLSVPGNQRATVTFSSLTSGFDPNVNVIAGAANCGTLGMDGGTAGSTCAGSSGFGSTFRVVNSGMTAATYLAVIDADPFSTLASGAYQISYTTGALPGRAGETCAMPTPITMSGTSEWTTSGATRDYTMLPSSCVASTGPESVFAVTVPNGQTLTATVLSLDADSVINVVDTMSCAATAQVCFDKKDVGFTGDPEVYTFTNSTGAAKQLFLLVSAYSGAGTATMDYSLTIDLR